MTEQSTDEFLATARKRFSAAAEEEKSPRDKFVSDLKFASPDGDEQWDPKIKAEREAANRPAMSFPRCHTFVQQVANQARQQKPQIKYAPSLNSDKDTADVIEGIARKIQYDSQAQVAYDTAIEYSAGGSFGYYRIITDYCDDETDEQEIKILPVLDPLAVYGVLIPSVFGRKVPWAFVVQDMPKDEYKDDYPDSQLASLTWTEAAKQAEGWIAEQTVRIAEYWYVEETKVKGKRAPKRTVKFCKTNGIEILADSETVWAGSTVPIIPVLGKQMIVDGKPKLFSVVRPQKAAQQMLNYAKSRIAETLAQAPVSPFIALEGQIAGHEAEWRASNTSPVAVLQYKGVDVAGHPAPPPQRQTFEPPIAALSQFVLQESEDMKATTGIYDASLGNKSNETSGQAIARRQGQSDLTTMHFMDNLERSFKQGGDVIAELIPKIYDTEREITILGADESQKVITINGLHTDATGNQKHYKVSDFKGKYVVTMGKAYSSKRAESFDTMAQIIQTAPNMFPMIGDIMLRNSDMAGADEAADRLHAMLPPALQKNDNNPIPPQAQAMIAHGQQQVQMMQGELQKLTMEREAKVIEHQGKMQQIQLQGQVSMALEDKKLEAAITVAEISTKAQNISERLAAVEDMWKQLHSQAHESALAAQQAAHDQAASAQQAQQQSQMADQSAEHQSAQSAQDAAQSQQAQEQAAQQEQGAQV